jgi:nucleoside-triphosphatase THEP1
MYDKEKRLEKVITFYQSLPAPLLEEIINNLPINRDIRRKVNKIKTLREKVKMLISCELRRVFADTAFVTIKELVPLSLNTSSYDDIITSISEDNKLYIAIFFFRWCYEYGDDGSSNDEKYFDKFVDSEIFDCILKNKKIDNPQSTSHKNEPVSRIDTSLPLNEVETSLAHENNYEVNTMKLLGRIEKRNTFYNFFPQYELNEGELVEISNDKLREDYPTDGAINLAYNPYSGGAASFLDRLTTDLDDDQYVNNVYVAEIDKNHLEPNDNSRYQVKLDLQRLVSKGKNLHDMINYADEYGIYKVVHSEEDTIPNKIFISGNIYLLEPNITDGEMVVLFYNEKYYGPFKASHKQYDERFFINTLAIENNYLVPFFSIADIEVVELEKQAYNKEPTYTKFIQTSLNNKQFEDIITDEILLEKMTDDVSIELVATNREEFFHLCSNSPFLARLPQEIVSKRLDRLVQIVNNVESLKEKKHEVFESLLKIYQEAPSEKMIMESEAYKGLQSKYNEERRKSEDADKTIQELRKAQEEYNAQIVELRKSSEGTASSEEVLKLREEIDKLTSELEKKDRIIRTNESIENLEERKKGLQTINEELISQRNDYSRQIENLRTDVSNAIKSGKAEMASLAFDPFISSEMMKQAASWETTEEDKQYKEKLKMISEVAPSSLNDTDLIDYIVNYVKERREYSRNDIINIYISIAQNFITIFSGEPGTGKTSMCNIVAETLGLQQAGRELNRFVSVSVERGWSSKRDLIGYYNPLTRKYDKSNGKIYDALRVLDVEREESKYPFIILLDEANLSPIEYYWADFMRLTDRSSLNDKYINIGTERELYVPETLKFVATINTDQTTETLSPRLIDRACIIRLPKVNIKKNTSESSKATEIITWKNFQNTFSKKSELNIITNNALKAIYKLFNDYGMSVSPRIDKIIENYIMAAQEIMEDEPNTLAREKALDFAVVQKLLPKINGYYNIYERFFDSLKQLCKEYNLNMTEDAIIKIIDAQERNMGYCQYLI